MDRSVRSRTSSTSSLPGPPPATPSHTNPTATPANRLTNNNALSPDLLAAGLSRIRVDSSRNTSIPPTPAPTPNPLLQVSHHMHPEQLVAGIKQLRVDEGYIDSTSIPGTPAPSPFSPSPAQFTVFSPDQVAEGIKRLREEAGVSGASTGQPPTPSTTPGPGAGAGAVAAAAAAAAFGLVGPNQQLGIIPEHLVESIQHLRCDEGMESDSNPATPVPTPISPSPAGFQKSQVVPPEQLVAGIHRLKVEEGMSSGGSSGFPSTPAPTPFSHYPGGVRPEDLAAGISRLSVIEETNDTEANKANIAINVMDPEQPSLSSYFSNGKKNIFDQIQDEDKTSLLSSIHGSRVNLPELEQQRKKSIKDEAEAELDVVDQSHDDIESLQRRHSHDEKSRSRNQSASETIKVCNIFSEVKEETSSDPFDNINIERPIVLETAPNSANRDSNQSEQSSTYATPVAPTPIIDPNSYSTYSPLPPQFINPSQPITTPLPSTPQLQTQAQPQAQAPQFEQEQQQQKQPQREQEDPALYELIEEAWIPNQATAEILNNMNASTPGTYFPDRSVLTMPGVASREDLSDPIRNLINHYRGENEASRRQVLTMDSVSQDFSGLRQLIRSGCYRAAVNLTARLLASHDQGFGSAGTLSKHSPLSIQIWFIRLALLVKLKQFNIAQSEADSFGPHLDRPDLYYEFYPDIYDGRRGPMVPFGFRVLIAEIPQYTGKFHETLDRLYAILETVKQIRKNLSKGKTEDQKENLPPNQQAEKEELWKNRELRIMYSLANCFILQKDYEMAMEILNSLIKMERETKKPKLLSGLGRLYLQLGDVSSAEESFASAKKLRRSGEVDDEVETLLDSSFIAMSNNNFELALEVLKKAEFLRPNDPVIVNNTAVSLIYLGRLSQGLTLLESNMTARPGEFLSEVPILNLSTLYELESSYAGQKKQGLLTLVGQHKGDGISSTCLKLQI